MALGGITLGAGMRKSLGSLQSTQESISMAQLRLGTGKKVNSALDNALNFFTSQGLENRAKAMSSVQDNIAMGMKVIYYDVVNLMGMGTATQVPKLEDLLRAADFVTLHVPEIEDTKGMIGEKELDQMRTGAYLLNASRGSVVDIPALIKVMQAGKLGGAESRASMPDAALHDALSLSIPAPLPAGRGGRPRS